MINVYSESGRNIHRIVAVILAVTTWITVKEIIPEYAIFVCVITGALEFSAYKTISNRTLSDHPAYYYAAVAITIASSLFSLASGFVLESAVKGRFAATAVEQSKDYSNAAAKIMQMNQTIVDKHEESKKERLLAIDKKYDKYQAEIGTTWWKRDFEKNPQGYRRYSKSIPVGRWVAQRDSLEMAREKEKMSIASKELSPGLLASIPEDFSSNTIQAGSILSVATRYSIIIIDLFCFIIVISVIRNSEEQEREGMTDGLLIGPILIGRAMRRYLLPVAKNEEIKDVELEKELQRKEAQIKHLKKELEAPKEEEINIDPIKEPAVDVDPEGKIIVGDRSFAHKKSLQTAISRERARGNEEEAKKLQVALEEYVRKHFPHLSSPGGN